VMARIETYALHQYFSPQVLEYQKMLVNSASFQTWLTLKSAVVLQDFFKNYRTFKITDCHLKHY
ncbi:hypothetical protein AAUPMC_16060, partial [Pasteurella multocida subsp. multocida str. Anand1_cattle]